MTECQVATNLRATCDPVASRVQGSLIYIARRGEPGDEAKCQEGKTLTGSLVPRFTYAWYTRNTIARNDTVLILQ